jgi:pyridoxamine 5'-phosphate oxidase
MNTDPSVLKPVLSAIRHEFAKGELVEKNINADPLLQFESWLKQAFAEGNPAANTMVLSTVDEDGSPSSRVMLLKDLNSSGFSFYTNYKSQKGVELQKNSKAALLFFWPEMERQVRIQGDIKLLPEVEADIYFESRPFESKVGAWASQQSQIIENRGILDNTFTDLLEKYKNKKVPRPPYWGGYILAPRTIEFWQGRKNRLHDRLLFKKNTAGIWEITRLMP